MVVKIEGGIDVQTLKEKCQQLHDYHRGGWVGLHSYHAPIVPAELADEVNDRSVVRHHHAELALGATE